MSERERMLAGRPYRAWLEELPEQRGRARRLAWEYNHLPPERWAERPARMRELLGRVGERFTVEPDFHCDYGSNFIIRTAGLRRKKSSGCGSRNEKKYPPPVVQRQQGYCFAVNVRASLIPALCAA